MQVKRRRTDPDPVQTHAAAAAPSTSTSLVTHIGTAHPDSALAATRRTPFAVAADAFVGALSAGAQAYLAQLPTPAATACDGSVTPTMPPIPTRTAPPIPPHLAEELFVFADYALLDALQEPATAAMMKTMTLPRALELLYVCGNTHRQRGRGYLRLKHRCQAFLAERFAMMVQHPAYLALAPRQKDAIDRILRRHVDQALADGGRRDLPPLQDAILHHIRAGHFSDAALDKGHVFAWLCHNASPDVWEALHAQGYDMQHLATRHRAAAFRQAARAGRRDLLALMWHMVPPRKRDILWSACEHGALRYAVMASDRATVATLLALLTPAEHFEIAGQPAVWEAAATSHEGAMVQYLRQRLPDVECGTLDVLHRLASFGHLEAVADLLHGHPRARSCLRGQDYLLLRKACQRGDLEAAQILLTFAAPFVDILEPLLRAGIDAIAVGCGDSVRAQELTHLLEDAARTHGIDIFEDIAQDALTYACEEGHAYLVRRALMSMGGGERQEALAAQAEVHGRLRSLLDAACFTGQNEVIDTLLAFSAPDRHAALVLQHEGAALSCATYSGDLALVQRLLRIARAAPDALRAWQSDANLAHMLRAAVVSDQPDMLKFWLDAMPETRRADFIRDSRLVANAMASGGAANLVALFRMVEADTVLTDTLLRQATAPDPGDVALSRPLGLALRYGLTTTADVVLDRIALPSRRESALRDCFEDLCCTDLQYFVERWETFAPSTREALLTPTFWAELPRKAGAEVAVYLIDAYPEPFARALRPLQTEHLTLEACDTAQVLIAEAPAGLQERMIEAWGPQLLRTTLQTHRSLPAWDFLRQRMRRETILELLAANGNTLYYLANAPLAARLRAFVLLGRPWHAMPAGTETLVPAAVQDMVRRDDAALLRELLARNPEMRHRAPLQRLLRPNNPEWTQDYPRIAALLRGREGPAGALAHASAM